MAGNLQSIFDKLFGHPNVVPPSEISATKQLTTKDVEYLSKFGVTMQGIQEAVNKETSVQYDRLSLFNECVNSLSHPIISGALEIYTSTATVYNKEQNATVWVTSDNSQYQKTLEKMFNRINLEERIYDWAYTIAYAGDLFLELNGQPGTGIVSVLDNKSPIEFYRIENNGQLIGFYHQYYSGQTKEPNSLLPPWRFVQLSLLGARKRRPVFGDNYGYRTSIIGIGGNTFQESTHYGSPLIMAALPVYKRLRLSEDCILMSRATRTPLKYIYKIGISNDGCFSPSTKIKLLDGTTPTIKEMADNKDKYIGRSILTVNPETQELVVGKILDAKPTRKNAELVRVWLDNNTYADSTLDHRYMLRNGTYKEAQDLVAGESLMPLYTKYSDKVLKNYEIVYNPGINKWNYTHRLVGKYINNGNSIPKGKIVHHKDFNKLNNDVSNLEIMTNEDHYNLHAELGHLNYGHNKGKKQSDQHLNNRRESLRKEDLKHKLMVTCACGCGEKFICNLSFLKVFKNREHWSNSVKSNKETRTCICGCKELFQCYKNSPRKYFSKKCEYKLRTKVNEWRNCKCGCGYKKLVKISDIWQYKRGHQDKTNWINAAAMTHRGKPSWNSKKILNHKVVKIEFLTEREDTYDLTIDGFPNFPLANGVFVHNSNVEAIAEIIKTYGNILKRARSYDTTAGQQQYNDRLNNLGVAEDVICPVWGDVDQLKVEKLGGDVDVKWITDVDKLEDQLCTALAIPKPLLGGEAGEGAQGLSPNSSLENMDVRFARNVKRIQRALITGITRLCQIHLAYLGLDPDESLFQVHMSESSDASAKEQRENMQLAIDITGSLYDTLTKVVGEQRLNREKLFDIVNEQYLKLPDMTYEDLLLPPDKINTPVPEEGGAKPTGGITPGQEPGAPPIINASKDTTKRKPLTERMTSLDFRADTILNESEWQKTYGQVTVTVEKQEVKT